MEHYSLALSLDPKHEGTVYLYIIYITRAGEPATRSQEHPTPTGSASDSGSQALYITIILFYFIYDLFLLASFNPPKFDMFKF